MVCERCEEKLSALVVPDKWRDGARSAPGAKDDKDGKDGKSGKISTNKLLKRRADRLAPIERKCRICKCKAAQHAHYCNQCAYKKGICSMCGRKVLDTKEFNMSA